MTEVLTRPYLMFGGCREEALEFYRTALDALSDGAQVQMPLEKTFWSSRFGMFTDRFGISWMISVVA
ncbi:MAG: hypothetical protein KA524_10760 [Nitrosomonas sp.]|nr:hypothetical protein [Nitrosomonas sp.]MBP6076864.1 hypothetical protein [Nitrosomonas sp.]